MDNNANQPEKRTSLRFEIGTGSEDTAPAPTPAAAPIEPAPAPAEPAPAPRVSSFVHDPVRVRTTYVPRFTDVSDTYRMSDDKRFAKKEKAPEVKEEEKSSEPTVDPTSETLEESNVEKLVVTSSRSVADSYSDESIKVYKFDGVSEIPPSDAASETFEKIKAMSESYGDTMTADPSEAGVTPDSESAPVESVEEKPVADEPFDKAPAVAELAIARRIFTAKPVPEKHDENEPIAEIDRGGKRVQNEFRTSIQRDTVKDRFIDALLAIKIRIAFAIIITIGAFVFECIGLFGNNFFASLGLVKNTEAIIDIFIITALALIALPEITGAFKRLFGGTPSPELSLPISYFVLVGYSLAVLLTNKLGEKFMTFSILFAIEVLVALFASYMKVSADFTSFKVSSRNAVKQVIDKRLTRSLVRENMALDGVIDEYNSKTARIFKTAFVSDFFYRSSRGRENKANSVILLILSMMLGAAVGCATYFMTKDTYPILAAYEAAAMVFLVSLPTFSILVHKLPLRHVISEARLEKSTFIGEESIYDVADTDVVGYEDTDLFGKEDVTLKKVHLYGKVFNTVKAMKEMYSLFSVVGGPLAEVFSSALDRKCAQATGVVVEEDGVYGSFEGHKVMAGTEEFMRRHKVTIPDDDYKTKTFATDSTKVMYGAEDGAVYVKFFIRYSFSEEFTMFLPDLKKKQVTPLVYTRDPNIDCELLRMLTLGEDIIRVVKLDNADAEQKVYRKLSSGVVSLGTKSNIVNTILLSKRYTSFQSVFAISELLAMILGASLGVSFALLFMGKLSTIPSFVLAVWQLVWCVMLNMCSRASFRVKRSIKGKK